MCGWAALTYQALSKRQRGSRQVTAGTVKPAMESCIARPVQTATDWTAVFFTLVFCGCNHLRRDPKLFILMIAIKLLMRMENKICGSVFILLKIMVIFPLTLEGSETLAFFFYFAMTRTMYCRWDVSVCHVLEIQLLTLQICEQRVQLLFFLGLGVFF